MAAYVATCAGCSGRQATSQSDAVNSLLLDLRERGVTKSSTAFLVFQGSGADFGPDVTVRVTDRETIARVWRSIQSASPTAHWAASGWREVQFFSQGASTPRAILQVNETDASRVVGEQRPGSTPGREMGLQKCDCLQASVMARLDDEYARRKDRAAGR